MRILKNRWNFFIYFLIFHNTSQVLAGPAWNLYVLFIGTLCRLRYMPYYTYVSMYISDSLN